MFLEGVGVVTRTFFHLNRVRHKYQPIIISTAQVALIAQWVVNKGVAKGSRVTMVSTIVDSYINIESSFMIK